MERWAEPLRVLPALLVLQAERSCARHCLEPRADVPRIFLIPCTPRSLPPCWEVGSPQPCEGFALLIISWISPICTLGFSQTPIISNPLHLSKVIWRLIIGQTKQLGAPVAPMRGPGPFKLLSPSFSSVWAPLSLGKAAERACSRQIPSPN